MKKMKIKNNNGYLLIEAMIAMVILSIGFLAILGLLSNSLKLNRLVSDQFIANYLAMEGIEITKNFIDSNTMQKKPFNEGFSDGIFELDFQSRGLEDNQNRFLKFNPETGRYSYQNGNNSPFTRTVKIEQIDQNPDNPGAEEIKVNSIIQWKSQSSGNFEINLEDYFFDWRR